MLRVPDQGARQGQALPHAEGVAAHSPVGRLRQADQLQHGLAPRAHRAGLGGDDAEVVAGAAGRVEALVDDRPDHLGRVLQRPVGSATEARRPGSGCVQPEQQPHARRLPGAVRPQERGDPAGRDLGGQIVQGGDRPELLGESFERDDG